MRCVERELGFVLAGGCFAAASISLAPGRSLQGKSADPDHVPALQRCLALEHVLLQDHAPVLEYLYAPALEHVHVPVLEHAPVLEHGPVLEYISVVEHVRIPALEYIPELENVAVPVFQHVQVLERFLDLGSWTSGGGIVYMSPHGTGNGAWVSSTGYGPAWDREGHG